MIDDQTLGAAEAHMRRLLSADTGGHGPDHVLRVRRLVATIARAEGADVPLCELAALLHDVDDHKLFPETHATLGNAAVFMRRHGLSKSEAEQVSLAIRETSFSANGFDRPTSLEAACLRDADRLDAIGAIGAGRAFAYGGAHGRPLWDGTGEDRATTIAHFEDKLLLLGRSMCTATGARLASERAAFLRDFYEEFVAEWVGER